MRLPSSVQTKLDRAQEHFDCLVSEIEAFNDRDPYRVTPDHNSDMTEHYLRLSLVEPFPNERWGAILGDGLHDLRSALDHLIWAIAVRDNGGADPPDTERRRLMFPILDPPRTLAMNRIDSLSPEVRAAVSQEQPNPAKLVDSPLWTVDQLNNADKHRIIHMTLTHGDYGSFLIKPSVPCTFVPTWNTRPLNSGAPLLTLTFDRPVRAVETGSVGTVLVGIDWIDPNDPKVIIFWPIGDLGAFVGTGVRDAIARVAAAAGLE